MNTYNNGLGELLGDSLATSKPVITPGFVWFVNSVGGVDAASPAGRDRQKPLATLAQAQTNAVAGDTILLEDGHTESLAATLTIAKQLYIVGGGSSAGVPTVNFAASGANGILSLTAAGTQLRNIRFKVSVVANANIRVSVSVAARLKNLYVECGPNDTGQGMQLTANNIRVNGCTFVSTATVVASRPGKGLESNGAISDIDLEGSVFDEGTVGFATAACDLSNAAITRLTGDSISLLRGAELLMNAGSTGFLNPTTTTGGGRITW